MLAIASTTHEDLHGMRISKSALLDFRNSISENYIRYQINHNDDGPKLGVLAGAKLFEFPDGETGLSVIIIKHSDPEKAAIFSVGGLNNVFDQFQEAIVVDFLLALHAVKMANYVRTELSLEDQLEAFFQSHIVGADGQIRTNKYLVTKVGGFRIEVYPEDHRPAHFHLISKPRKIDVRFTIDPLEWLSDKQGTISNKDEKIVKLFFRTHPSELKKLKLEAKRLKLNN